MFEIGTKIVHPFHGAGIIVKIQRKSIGDTSHPYYIINTISRAMQVMVPVNRVKEANLRPVAPEQELRAKLAACSEAPQDHEISKDLRARQTLMREQLKSGDFEQITQVARILYFMSDRRPLGTVDRQLLEQSKNFLAGELALAADLEIAEAKQEIETYLMSMFEEDDSA